LKLFALNGSGFQQSNNKKEEEEKITVQAIESEVQ